jgi:hypothetical protein
MDVPRLLARLSVNYEMCGNCGEMFYLDPDVERETDCAECASRAEYLIQVGNGYGRHVYKYHNHIGALENLSTNTLISSKVATLRKAVRALEYAYRGESVEILR